MEKKRPMGVAIIGGLFLVGGVLSLFNLFNWKLTTFKYVGYGYFMFFYNLIATPSAIIAGVFLLKLKNWARKLCIILELSAIVFTMLTPFTLAKELTDNTTMVIFSLAIGIISTLLIIYYLTRPKIKAMFTGQVQISEKPKGIVQWTKDLLVEAYVIRKPKKTYLPTWTVVGTFLLPIFCIYLAITLKNIVFAWLAIPCMIILPLLGALYIKRTPKFPPKVDT